MEDNKETKNDNIVILPCRKGDHVYAVSDTDGIGEYEVETVEPFGDVCQDKLYNVILRNVNTREDKYLKFSTFNRMMFQSREEAARNAIQPIKPLKDAVLACKDVEELSELLRQRLYPEISPCGQVTFLSALFDIELKERNDYNDVYNLQLIFDVIKVLYGETAEASESEADPTEQNTRSAQKGRRQPSADTLNEAVAVRTKPIDPTLKIKLAECSDIREAMNVVNEQIPDAFEDWAYLAGFLTGLLGFAIDDPEVRYDYKYCKLLLSAFIHMGKEGQA